MIKSLLRLVVFVVIAIVVYNFFMGTSTEKDSSKKVVKELKDVGAAVKDLLKSEKTKFEGGKYDEVLGNIGDVFNKLKGKAQDIDEKYLDRIARLDEKRKELEGRLESTDVDAARMGSSVQVNNTPEQKKLKKELRSLLDDTENLMQEMETHTGY